VLFSKPEQVFQIGRNGVRIDFNRSRYPDLFMAGLHNAFPFRQEFFEKFLAGAQAGKHNLDILVG